MFVDYAGQTAEVIDGATGEVRRAQVFVAVLGASNYNYAEARWTQSLPDWIGCHVGAFASFGGVARQIACDNLKAGVTAASRYEPGISRTYQDKATHYGTAIGVVHAVAQRVVEQHRRLARSGHDRFGFADPSCQTTVEGTQSRFGATDRHSRQTQQRSHGRRGRSLQLFKGCFDPNVAGGDLGLVGVIQFHGLQQCEDVLLTVIADQCLVDPLLGCLDALVAQPGKHRRIALPT